jgi:sodium/bile acid cotransporter 7
MTVNMVIVLTKAANGDEACALLNASLGNLLGVFVTPALILGYLGQTSNIKFVDVVLKLVYRVVIPIIFGQILQNCSKSAVDFVAKHKPKFAKIQEFCLTFIVYTVFCKTFSEGLDVDISGWQILLCFVVVALFVLLFQTLAWFALNLVFKDKSLVIMGFYGCHHKTVAMGLPLIKAIYEDDPRLGMYALPLLIWHPLQLLIGSALAPKLAAWSKTHESIPEEEIKDN